MPDKPIIIFDLDGTLIDSRGDLTDAVNEVLQLRGLQLLTLQQVVSYVGDGQRNLMKRAIPGLDDDDLTLEEDLDFALEEEFDFTLEEDLDFVLEEDFDFSLEEDFDFTLEEDFALTPEDDNDFMLEDEIPSTGTSLPSTHT